MEGKKDDTEKTRTDLLPVDALLAVAEVLTAGAARYGPDNWALGMAWHRPEAALLRHLWAWKMGQLTDPDSHLPHLAHAACNALFLLAYQLRGVGTDDRPVTQQETTNMTTTTTPAPADYDVVTDCIVVYPWATAPAKYRALSPFEDGATAILVARKADVMDGNLPAYLDRLFRGHGQWLDTRGWVHICTDGDDVVCITARD